MAFDSLKDQLKEKATELWSKIEESPFYNNLREKFETQSPTVQRGIIGGVSLLVILMLLSFPYSYFSSSSTHIEEYNGNRSLLRNLLRASRLASEASSAPATVSISDLKAQVQNLLPGFALLPEQIGGLIDLDTNALGGSLAPASIRQDGLGISLKKLNLQQVVDLGFEMQKINPSVKLSGMEVTASSENPHYFDVLYKLVVFNMPEPPPGAKEPTPPTGKMRPPPGADQEDEDSITAESIEGGQ